MISSTLFIFIFFVLVLNEQIIDAKYTRVLNRPKIDDKPHNIPKTMKSEEFESIPAYIPPTPSTPSFIESVMKKMFGLADEPTNVISKDNQKQIKSTNKKSSSSPLPNIDESSLSSSSSRSSSPDLSWIDDIKSDTALELLQKQLEKELSQLQKQLEKVKSKLNKKKTTTTDESVAFDLTKELFGNLSDQLKDLGITVKIFDLGSQEIKKETISKAENEANKINDGNSGDEKILNKPLKSVSINLKNLGGNKSNSKLLNENVNSDKSAETNQELKEFIEKMEEKSKKLEKELKKKGVSQSQINDANKIATEIAQKFFLNSIENGNWVGKQSSTTTKKSKDKNQKSK
eukprot:c19901_g1_i1.p1 GENE.c19901_g1_i1~~c19901_g1_i1.p1  ORF type:complete len:357 (+),score=148.14 c19901_g1_i1:34-1071(+)